MSIYTKPPQVSRRAVVAWREQVVSHMSTSLGVALARSSHDFVRGGGLEQKKVAALPQGFRAIEKRFGRVDLSEARTLNDEDLFEFLADLPEVGPKSARCIMLYAFGRPAFPVDAHVGRVLARLDVLRPVVGDLLHIDHRQRQKRLADAIPPDLRYALHVNLIVLGRDVCVARRPRCRDCALLKRCAHAKGETVRRSAE